MSSYADQLYQTLVNIIRIPSTSGQETYVRAYLEKHLNMLGLATETDSIGNLVATLAGEGEAILLNAHMDRVPPGLGHQPILRDGILYSDGTTNLGADDAAGITIILEVLRRIIEQKLPHPPLVMLFTVQEESGLCGANGFDAAKWHVQHGIVFDNAFEAGVVVSQGAAYEAFDIDIRGKTGHPGKDVSETVNAIDIFRTARFPTGSLAQDQTRITLGLIEGGQARNAVPDRLIVKGEMRSFEAEKAREPYRHAIQQALAEAAHQHGGEAEVTFDLKSAGYRVNPDEPLLHIYRSVLAHQGETLRMQPTFVGSDTGGLRPQVQVFTLSTGVSLEHTSAEHVALAPLEKLVKDTLHVLQLWRTHSITESA